MRSNGVDLSTGTGFVVQSPRGPVLVTNRHNVTGRRQDNDQPLHSSAAIPDELVIWHNRTNQLGQWVSRSEPLYGGGGSRRWIEHPTYGAQVDCVALPLQNLDEVQLHAYDLANPGPAIVFRPTDVVSVVGFPFGLVGAGMLAVWATGFVASEPDVDYFNLPIFLIDCRGRPGQSGSPVLAHRSGMAHLENGSVAMINSMTRFLGVYSGRINEQSDLGIVWKLAAVKAIVDSV